jgi:hypothetical protein
MWETKTFFLPWYQFLFLEVTMSVNQQTISVVKFTRADSHLIADDW